MLILISHVNLEARSCMVVGSFQGLCFLVSSDGPLSIHREGRDDRPNQHPGEGR